MLNSDWYLSGPITEFSPRLPLARPLPLACSHMLLCSCAPSVQLSL